MHTNLVMLYAATNGSYFSPNQCDLIVRELATVDLSSIPSEQTSNVMEFLNMQLLHEQVDSEILRPIEALATGLASRLAMTKVS